MILFHICVNPLERGFWEWWRGRGGRGHRGREGLGRRVDLAEPQLEAIGRRLRGRENDLGDIVAGVVTHGDTVSRVSER